MSEYVDWPKESCLGFTKFTILPLASFSADLSIQTHTCMSERRDWASISILLLNSPRLFSCLPFFLFMTIFNHFRILVVIFDFPSARIYFLFGYVHSADIWFKLFNRNGNDNHPINWNEKRFTIDNIKMIKEKWLIYL